MYPIEGSVSTSSMGKRLQNVDSESRQVGNFADHIKVRGGDSGLGDGVRTNVHLVHDHVGEVRRDEAAVVPGVSFGGADDATAVWEGRIGRQFAGVGIALESSGTCAVDLKPIQVAVLRG